ncbi:MAG: ATP synthase F1 subunit epsilon [Planctomycetes bacterium]|nr:ATP synthase F1 subunit epsilon [Planctomycetota bacterium]
MAESSVLHVDIISPAKPVYSGEANGLVVPAHDGEMGILKLHAPMVAQLGIGEIRIHRETLGGTTHDYFAIYKGFLQTKDNRVIVITEDALAPDDVDEAAVRTEAESVGKQLKSKMSQEERDTLKERYDWLLVQARVARHARKGMGGHGSLERTGLTMTMDKAAMEARAKSGKTKAVGKD